MMRMMAVLLCCSVLHGQGSPAPEATPAGRTTGPFRFSISTDKLIYRPEETITLTSVLHNETDHDLSLSMTPRVSFYGMDVRLPSPDWLPFRTRTTLSEEGQRRKYPGFTSATGHILKPGGEIIDKFELDKMYTMPIPGEYRVAFYFRAPDYVGKNVIVTSNEIAFTIAERK